MGVRRDVGLGADHGIRFDPYASSDVRTSRDLNTGLDVRARFHDRAGVDLRAVRDQSSTVRVLAIAQRLTTVVLDVDVVLTHDPLQRPNSAEYRNNLFRH